MRPLVGPGSRGPWERDHRPPSAGMSTWRACVASPSAPSTEVSSPSGAAFARRPGGWPRQDSALVATLAAVIADGGGEWPTRGRSALQEREGASGSLIAPATRRIRPLWQV